MSKMAIAISHEAHHEHYLPTPAITPRQSKKFAISNKMDLSRFANDLSYITPLI